MGSLAFLTLALAIGGTVDISMVMRSGTAAQGAADAAALAGAKRMETGTADEAQATIQSVALANLPDDLKGAQIKGEIDTKKGVVGVTISGQYDTAFLRLAHMDAIPYTRSSLSTIKRDGFMDFYFLLDVSESMNIAADATEREKLKKISGSINGRPCAFACHTAEPEHGHGPISVYDMNRNNPPWEGGPARLRIDVLREAFSTAINNLLSINADKSKNLTIRISTAGFSETFSPGVIGSDNVKELTDSLAFSDIASKHTDTSWALKKFTGMLGPQYDGSAPEKPEKVAVFITDGLNDVGDFQTGPVDVTYCNRIKAKGIKLAVLEIKYVADYGEGFFLSRVAPKYPLLSPALMMCASPGYYYLATDSRQASEKLAGLANDIVRQNLRIRQ